MAAGIRAHDAGRFCRKGYTERHFYCRHVPGPKILSERSPFRIRTYFLFYSLLIRAANRFCRFCSRCFLFHFFRFTGYLKTYPNILPGHAVCITRWGSCKKLPRSGNSASLTDNYPLSPKTRKVLESSHKGDKQPVNTTEFFLELKMIKRRKT